MKGGLFLLLFFSILLCFFGTFPFLFFIEFSWGEFCVFFVLVVFFEWGVDSAVPLLFFSASFFTRFFSVTWEKREKDQRTKQRAPRISGKDICWFVSSFWSCG